MPPRRSSRFSQPDAGDELLQEALAQTAAEDEKKRAKRRTARVERIRRAASEFAQSTADGEDDGRDAEGELDDAMQVDEAPAETMDIDEAIEDEGTKDNSEEPEVNHGVDPNAGFHLDGVPDDGVQRIFIVEKPKSPVPAIPEGENNEDVDNVEIVDNVDNIDNVGNVENVETVDGGREDKEVEEAAPAKKPRKIMRLLDKWTREARGEVVDDFDSTEDVDELDAEDREYVHPDKDPKIPLPDRRGRPKVVTVDLYDIPKGLDSLLDRSELGGRVHGVLMSTWRLPFVAVNNNTDRLTGSNEGFHMPICLRPVIAEALLNLQRKAFADRDLYASIDRFNAAVGLFEKDKWSFDLDQCNQCRDNDRPCFRSNERERSLCAACNFLKVACKSKQAAKLSKVVAGTPVDNQEKLKQIAEDLEGMIGNFKAAIEQKEVVENFGLRAHVAELTRTLSKVNQCRGLDNQDKDEGPAEEPKWVVIECLDGLRRKFAVNRVAHQIAPERVTKSKDGSSSSPANATAGPGPTTRANRKSKQSGNASDDSSVVFTGSKRKGKGKAKTPVTPSKKSRK